MPNRSAQHLASGRSSLIGVVFPSDGLRSDPYAAAMIDAIGRAAAKAGFGTLLHLEAGAPPEQVFAMLQRSGSDGLIVSALAASAMWISELAAAGVPVVYVGRPSPDVDLPFVTAESFSASIRATEHLFEQGCRTVACLTGPLDRPDARDRYDGFVEAHRLAGLPIDDSLVVVGDFTAAAGVAAVEELLRLGVDGVVAANDLMARGVVSGLVQRGVAVPGEIAVVGYDGTVGAGFPGAHHRAAAVRRHRRAGRGDADRDPRRRGAGLGGPAAELVVGDTSVRARR
ncbi:MAG: substrate-binding domain-containing protein [Ilumatobacteraceae bacterium]